MSAQSIVCMEEVRISLKDLRDNIQKVIILLPYVEQASHN